MKNLYTMALIGGAMMISQIAEGKVKVSPESVLDSLPAYNGQGLELNAGSDKTEFMVWAPEAEAAEVFLYPTDRNSAPTDTILMAKGTDGVWTAAVARDLRGQFYTFRIKHSGTWLKETPGIYAKALGTNGERAAIIDMGMTDPEGWDSDKGPALQNITDAVIYEMHHRDFSVHPTSGIVHKGKFLALTEEGTTTPDGQKTGIDHLKELGITHVHILPSYDFNSVDESQLASNTYNWGYDPVNYNAPDGSYSTDPADPAVRIREMKRMVKALHDAGIGVVMDVVYNHTSLNDDSNFSLTAPGYFYRHNPDGSYSDASGCGNETASERQMMRDFIKNSTSYWAKEYHIDGFRFDLMGIHDIETMNEVADTLKKINPDIFIYGEGWTAGASPLAEDKRALKMNVARMPEIAVFSDDIRDGVKGHYSRSEDRGFATGKPGLEETVKIGIVGSTAHRQVDYTKGSNAKRPYAANPTQVINYVSCHDDLMLTDKLAASMPGSSEADRQRAARLAQTIVFTSQGTPFMWCGEEIFRNKQGVHNSYKSPDSINAIDWSLKSKNREQFDYYRELIRLRKEHPAFRMTTAEDLNKHLVFDDNDTDNFVSYTLKDNANGDSWKEIRVAFNGSSIPRELSVKKGDWTIIADDGKISADGLGSTRGGKLTVAPCSALILAR